MSELPAIVDNDRNGLSIMARSQFRLLLEELKEQQDRLTALDKQLQQISASHPTCQRLMSMTGIGPLIASALYAGVGQGQEFQ